MGRSGDGRAWARAKLALVIEVVARQFSLFSVLRHREFRVYWIGLQSQVIGQQMMQFTLGWLAFELTRSPLTVGYVTLFLGIPPITIGLLGGVLADRMDQRKVIATAQATATAVMMVIATLTIIQRIEVWHLMLAAFVLGSVFSFDQPSRQSLYPRLLPNRALLAQAVPLNAMTWQISRPLAPVLGGFIIAYAGSGLTQGAGPAFATAGASFLTMGVLILRLRPSPNETPPTGSFVRNLVEGMRYVQGHTLFRVVLGMTYVNSLAGLGFIFLLPVFAGEVLDVDARGLSALWAGGGAGSFLAVLTTPAILRRYPAGRVMLAQGLLFGASLLVFSFTRSLVAGVAIQVVVGFGSLAYMMAVEVTIQTSVPDSLRGRVMSLYGLAWTFPALGSAGLNFIAEAIGSPGALALGGATVLANVALVGLFSRGIRDLPLTSRSRGPAGLAETPAGVS